MNQLLRAFVADESGFILTAELVLVVTIVVLGLMAALIAVRDAVGGELTDVANAFRSLDQSYYYGGMGARKNFCGFKSWTAGSSYGTRQQGPAVIEQPVQRQSDLVCPPEKPIVQPAPCATGDCYPSTVVPAPAPIVAPCGPGNPCGPVVPYNGCAPAVPYNGCAPVAPQPIPVPQPLVW